LRTSLQRSHRLGLRGRDRGLDPPTTALGDLPAQLAKGFDIGGMDGQLMNGGAFRGTFGERPTLQRIGTRVKDILRFRAGQSRRERDIDGEVDRGIDAGGRGHGGSTVGSTKGLLRGGHIGVRRPRHAEGGCHSLPAMTGLAREVGDLVHGRDGRKNL
jgi:hypothetical protein